jgi:hypothetical protein
MKKLPTNTFSIFGQIEEAAAEHMIKQNKAVRIPLEQFPSRRRHPDVWKNKEGQLAKFAVRVPKEHREEFEATVESLRA